MIKLFPEASKWSMKELHQQLEVAAAAYVARLDRGSTADSERMAVLQLVLELGERRLRADAT